MICSDYTPYPSKADAEKMAQSFNLFRGPGEIHGPDKLEPVECEGHWHLVAAGGRR